MKLPKFILFVLILVFISSNVYAAKNCDEIKGNIVGKLFCKAKTDYKSGSNGSNNSDSTEESGGWKIWKKPEWMKKKN